MQRRTLLAAAVAGAVPLALKRPEFWPVSRLQPVGLQLYTVRGLMEKDFDGTLVSVAKVGYREVEFAGYFGRKPDQVRAALVKAGLAGISAHVPLDSLGSNWMATLEAATTMGHQYLMVPSVPEAKRKTLDDWKALGEQFNKAGDVAAKHQIQFGYHNHDYEFAPIAGKLPYDVLLENTDDALVRMEMDIYWITKGGQNPLAYFKKWPGRFPLVHVKDMAANGAMVDVGAGKIDWQAIYAARDDAGIKHWFVEHDQPADPIGSLMASYKYMDGLK